MACTPAVARADGAASLAPPAGAPAPEELVVHVGPPRALERSICGGFAVRHSRTCGAELHGHWPPALALGADTRVLARLGRDPRLLELDPARALYLDIETTGLHGGAGTWPFLVALGSFEQGPTGPVFVVWQGFLSSPSEERAMLRDIAERVRASSGLVTFFGKSFDRHRLEDKMRLHGIPAPFADAPHLDLYHPLRRLYGKALPDGRLATLERELVALGRIGDLPGSQAPAAWFDFLAGRPHHLEEVFEHNRVDVVSLAVLLAHLACTLDEIGPEGAALSGPPIARARALAELFEKERAHDDALHWCAAALARLEALPEFQRAAAAPFVQELVERRARIETRRARAARAPKHTRRP